MAGFRYYISRNIVTERFIKLCNRGRYMVKVKKEMVEANVYGKPTHPTLPGRPIIKHLFNFFFGTRNFIEHLFSKDAPSWS